MAKRNTYADKYCLEKWMGANSKKTREWLGLSCQTERQKRKEEELFRKWEIAQMGYFEMDE